MFIQVIEGRAGDAAVLRQSMDRWRADLMPGATGYLGTTAGVTGDGTFIALARFESAAAATANSERPEQGEWWAEMSRGFDGEVSFVDCDDVRELAGGGSDDAGFVQIISGHSSDVARMHDVMLSHADDMQAARPEIIGGLLLDCGDDRYIDALYFTSESAAREGEAKEIPADVRAEFEQVMGSRSDVRYYDLHDPILNSAT
jgi:hypothetical protein